MAHPEIALAASAREWSDRLHRFLLDHGGGVVTGRVMSADQAVSESFDVLLIDDVCSFLTPRLVVELRRSGKAIVGVFAPDDGPDAKRRLLEVGISDVVETGASPEEFLSLARASVAHTPDIGDPGPEPVRMGFSLGVTGPPGGVGVTEVAIGVARNLAERHAAALIDLNQSWPAVGQRLALPVHPNLRTAVDLALHEPEQMLKAMHAEDGLSVVTGLANPGKGELPSADVVGLVAAMTSSFTHVVLDLGSVSEWSTDLLLRRVNALLVVGLGDPVGLTRLVRTCEMVLQATSDTDIGIVVNRVSNHGRQRDEVVSQLSQTLAGLPVVLIPEDSRIARARWDGVPVGNGPFHRQIRRLSSIFDEVTV